MKYKKSFAETIFDIFNTVFMIAFLLVTLYPMWYILVASISDQSLLLQHNKDILLWPLGINFSSYSYVLSNQQIINGYGVTLFVVIIGTALNVLTTLIAAYFLSRRNVFWKKIIMKMIVFTMFFSGGIIPLFLVVKGLKIYNTLWALILPTLLSTYNIIVVRTYLMSIPREIEESAAIDGANDIVVLFRLIVPLSMPVIAVIILWYGVGHWNEWFYASIFIVNKKLCPLQLVLRRILILGNVLEVAAGDLANDARQSYVLSIKYVVIIISTLPIIFAYPFLQKYFVKGIMIGSIKG